MATPRRDGGLAASRTSRAAAWSGDVRKHARSRTSVSGDRVEEGARRRRSAIAPISAALADGATSASCAGSVSLPLRTSRDSGSSGACPRRRGRSRAAGSRPGGRRRDRPRTGLSGTVVPSREAAWSRLRMPSYGCCQRLRRGSPSIRELEGQALQGAHQRHGAGLGEIERSRFPGRRSQTARPPAGRRRRGQELRPAPAMPGLRAGNGPVGHRPSEAMIVFGVTARALPVPLDPGSAIVPAGHDTRELAAPATRAGARGSATLLATSSPGRPPRRQAGRGSAKGRRRAIRHGNACCFETRHRSASRCQRSHLPLLSLPSTKSCPAPSRIAAARLGTALNHDARRPTHPGHPLLVPTKSTDPRPHSGRAPLRRDSLRAKAGPVVESDHGPGHRAILAPKTAMSANRRPHRPAMRRSLARILHKKVPPSSNLRYNTVA